MESILTSIKKILGITEEYEHFDADLIMHINSALMVLTQLGIGPSNGLVIKDKTTLWSELISEESNLELVKSYVGLKVKLLFDPPTSSAAMEASNRMINEFEWRLTVAASTINNGEEVIQNG